MFLLERLTGVTKREKEGEAVDRHMAHSLDNYITGHYGEDQFRNGVEPTCSNCKFPTQDFTCMNCAGRIGTVITVSHDFWCENWAEEEI